MTRVNLTGIHRVRIRLAGGRMVEYHYAWRGKGAPRFWQSDSGIKPGSPEYLAALAEATPKAANAKGMFREVIVAFLTSPEFTGKAPRTQDDLRDSIYHQKNGIDKEFGNAPFAAFADPRIRKRVLDWRDKIGGKVGDDRVRHLQRIVAFALDRAMLTHHQLRDIKSVHVSNRAEVLWHPDEIAAFEAGAPEHVARILIAACETGLRPGDLVGLSRQHLHPTPHGQRLVVWTKKRRRLASVPVTPKMAALIAATPAARDVFLVGARGGPYRHENYLGDAVSVWRDKLKLRRTLRLYDARGTAATRLLEAGADLKEIAVHMGWSVKHAAQVIEHYVALSPRMSDGLAAKLARAEAGTGV